jgi:zinc D-Ala-D-Ala carboxypeptidase
VTESLLSGLEDLRLGLVRMYPDVKVGITISSGFRCKPHNEEIGGIRDSLHSRGMAADIVVRGLTPTEVAAVAKQVTVFRDGGIGVYKGWVHVDVRRDGPARW